MSTPTSFATACPRTLSTSAASVFTRDVGMPATGHLAGSGIHGDRARTVHNSIANPRFAAVPAAAVRSALVATAADRHGYDAAKQAAPPRGVPR